MAGLTLTPWWRHSHRDWLAASWLLFVPAAVLAQPTRTHPFQGANTLLLTTPDRPARALHTLDSLLMHQGFTVQPLDSGRALLAQHALPNQRAVTSFQVMVAESSVDKQPATTTLLLFGFGPLEVAYRGKAMEPNKQAFRLLEAVAQAYAGAELKYQRNQ